MGVLGEVSGDGLNRTVNSFSGISCNMLMHQNKHTDRGSGDPLLVSFTSLSRIYLALLGLFLLFIPLASSVLEFGWHYGNNWASVT